MRGRTAADGRESRRERKAVPFSFCACYHIQEIFRNMIELQENRIMKNMSSMSSMTKKQRNRFILYCFLFFVFLLIFMSYRNRTGYARSAKMLCMSLPDEKLAYGFQDNGYDDEIYEAFLDDPYTELFYDTYNDVIAEECPDLDYEGISVDMMRDQPTVAADQIMVVYNGLTGEDKEAGTEKWTKLIAETKELIREYPEAQNPYADIHEKYDIERETETESELSEAETGSVSSAEESGTEQAAEK